MECGQGVQPVPNYRGNRFPGRCCPEYSYNGKLVSHLFMITACIPCTNLTDINECETRSENLCSDGCIDQARTYSCSCPAGRTLAKDGVNCGGKSQLKAWKKLM